MATSQILSVLSQLPLSTLAPSGEKEQEVTGLECPLRVRFSSPARKGAARSQTLSYFTYTRLNDRDHGMGQIKHKHAPLNY